MRKLVLFLSFAVVAFFGAQAASASPLPHSAVIIDNGGVLVTTSHLTPGELLTRGGTAYIVTAAGCTARGCTVVLSPRLPASDVGHALVFGVAS